MIQICGLDPHPCGVANYTFGLAEKDCGLLMDSTFRCSAVW